MRPEETVTPRELQCIRLLAEGLCYAEIAKRLRITHTTVKVHLKRSYVKLGVNKKSEAIAWWDSRFGPDAHVRYVEAKLADAEKTIELFPANFHRAVEAEVGRMIRIFVAVSRVSNRQFDAIP